jgi:hypothetical protein
MIRRHALVWTVRNREASTCSHRRSKMSLPTISDRQIWLIAAGLIAADLVLFMVPVVPFLAAYVLVVRPPWFKDFIDDVYDR